MNSSPFSPQARSQRLTRRAFLGRSAQGLGALALGALINPGLQAATTNTTNGHHGVINPPHFPPKAKRVIWLTMAGGPSHLETFDPKPKLKAMHGEPMPESVTKGKQIAQLQGQALKCFGPQFEFKA